MHLRLVYNADLFREERMVHMLDQYEHLLAETVEHPDRSVFGVSLITQAARDRLPDPCKVLEADWNGSVQARFAENARQTPEQVAISYDGQRLTYRQLDLWSNQLAHRLISGGIQSQDIVAVYGNRSPSLVCALLGILKAGAAFVILDPDYPAGRLVGYARIADPRTLLRLGSVGPLPDALQEFVDASSGTNYLELPAGPVSEDAASLDNFPETAPNVTVKADDLAYLAFTSGTTGQPKAVQGTHRPLSHFFPWYCRTFDLRSTDRFSMLSGLGHDPLLRDVFAPLWLGATICIPESDETLPDPLAAWINRSEISIAHLTPAHGQILTQPAATAGTNGRHLESLRYVFFGGDVLSHEDVARFRPLAHGATIVNFYGATETPQAISCYEVRENRRDGGTGRVPSTHREHFAELARWVRSAFARPTFRAGT
jgi:non-ribosomal peptide synthetase component F